MRSTTCLWSSFWTMRRKIPDLWVKFPLFKPPMIWYNRGEPGRPGSPPRCIQAFFILTFGYTGCRISMWFAGLPAAFRGWKLEAVKQAGDNPPAEMVQVITGSVCIAFLRPFLCNNLPSPQLPPKTPPPNEWQTIIKTTPPSPWGEGCERFS